MKRQSIRKMWTARLKGCQRDVDIWQEILSIRSLVMTPIQELDTYIEFASLCRKSGRLRLSYKVLTNLMGLPPLIYIEQPDLPLPKQYPPQVTTTLFVGHCYLRPSSILML